MRILSLEYRDDSQSIKITCSKTLRSQKSPASVLAVDKTNSLLATGFADGVTKVWDIRGAYATHTFQGSGEVVTSLLFFRDPAHSKGSHSDSLRLAVGYSDGNVRVWNFSSRKNVSHLQKEHTSSVRALDLDEQQGLLLSGSDDRTVVLRSTRDWKPQAVIQTFEAVAVAYFVGNGLLLVGGDSGNLRQWRTSGQPITSPRESELSPITRGVFCSLADQIWTVHADLTLRLHAIGDMRPLKVISGSHDEIIDCVLIGQSREYLAMATNVEEIKVLSIEQTTQSEENRYFGADVGQLKGHKDYVICLDVDTTGSWIVSGSKDNTAKLWRTDPHTGLFECVVTLTGHTHSVTAVALPRSDPDIATKSFAERLEALPKFVISGSEDRTIKHWTVGAVTSGERASGRATYTRKAHDSDINAIDVSSADALFASASKDRTVKIWSVEDGEVLGVLRGHRRGVWSTRFSPKGTPPITSDGRQVSNARGYMLTGSSDKTVKIWSLGDFSCIRTFEGHTNSILKAVWLSFGGSRDNKDTVRPQLDDPEADEGSRKMNRPLQVASAAGDGLVKVWNVNSEELAVTLDNHTDRVWTLVCQPETNALISGGGDGVVTYWRDTTSSSVAARAAASSARVEEDQRLQNYIKAGSYNDAITLALQLDHPGRLLSLFTAVAGTYPPEEDSLCGVKAVDGVVAKLSDEHLIKLLQRVRDWNTNAKTAMVAQRVLWTVLKTHSPKKLLELRTTSGRDPGTKDVLDALKIHTEKHYNRMDDMMNESFMVEWTLDQMDLLGGDSI